MNSSNPKMPKVSRERPKEKEEEEEEEEEKDRYERVGGGKRLRDDERGPSVCLPHFFCRIPVPCLEVWPGIRQLVKCVENDVHAT